MLRRRACSALTIVLLVTGLAAASAAAAQRPRTIASYCSPSGDVCFGIVDRNGAVYLELTTAARYFGRYRLCVRAPGTGAAARERCGSFPVFRRAGSTLGSSVRFARQFPSGTRGIYRVSWKLGSQRLGPMLRFRLPLRR